MYAYFQYTYFYFKISCFVHAGFEKLRWIIENRRRNSLIRKKENRTDKYKPYINASSIILTTYMFSFLLTPNDLWFFYC